MLSRMTFAARLPRGVLAAMREMTGLEGGGGMGRVREEARWVGLVGVGERWWNVLRVTVRRRRAGL